MKNKKLIVFNVVIFLVILSIVVIGRNSWATSHQAVEKTVVDDEQIVKEDTEEDEREVGKQRPIKELALLQTAVFKKKSKKDFDQFIREELDIVEIEEPETDLEDTLWEVEESSVEETVGDSYNSTTVTNTNSNWSSNSSNQVTKDKNPTSQSKPKPKPEKPKPDKPKPKPDKPKPKPEKPEPVEPEKPKDPEIPEKPEEEETPPKEDSNQNEDNEKSN